MEKQNQIRVIDIPMGTSAEECERLLNAVPWPEYYPGSFVLGELIGVPGIAHRVFFKRRAAKNQE
jgi:hypothetical protein